MAEAATIAATQTRIRLSWPLAVAVLSFGFVLLLGRELLGDPDIFWHIVTGRWIAAHGAVPHSDIYSYTMTGAKWVAHEWLADVLMAGAFAALGWHGLILMSGVAVAVAMAIFARALLAVLPPTKVLWAVLGAWVLLVPHLLARPHVIALPLMVWWLAQMVKARDAGRAPALPLALIMVPWANLHGSFLFGLGFAGMLMVEAVIAARGAPARVQAGRQWGGFIVAAALLALLTPNGIETYLLPWRLLNMHFATSVLIEWQSPDFGTFQPLEVWLIGALLGAAGMGLRLPWTRALMIALLIHFALRHARNGELLGFGAPLLAAQAIAAQLGARFQAATGEAAPMTSANPAGRWLAGAVTLAMALIALALPMQPRDGYMPAAAVQAVKDRRIDGPVLNAFSFGGFLIYSGIPTFIDGRADMFGDAFFEREHRAVTLQSDELPKLLEEYRVVWTIFPPQSRAAGALDRMPGWQRIYSDDVAVVHLRAGAAPNPPR